MLVGAEGILSRIFTVLVVAALLVGCAASPGIAAQQTDAASSRADRTPAPSRTSRASASAPPARSAEPTFAPTHAPASSPALGLAPTGPTQLATVASITDGDTIRVLIDGVNYPVRYIGIDTPEIHNGYEWMGREASDANAGLVAGRQVVLEKDVSETDRFGRLLRYVWLQNDDGWLLVNLELLRLGVAQVATYPPDVKYVDALYLPAQQVAVAAGIGLWGAGAGDAGAAVTATPAPAVIQPFVPPAASCEASYPDICIPIGSADLDCGDIDARRFTVRWDVPNPDPHRFDGNGDGVGCES